MIYLQQTADPQTISIIPRELAATKLIITSETHDTTKEIDIVAAINDYKLQITTNFDLVEGNFYSLKVMNGTKEVFRGKIFCTNQDPYSMNNNEFITNSTNNEYITL